MAFVFRVSEDLSRRKSVFLFSPQMCLDLYFLPTFHLLLCLQFIQAWLAAFYSPVSRGGCICRQGTLGDFSRHCIAFQWTTKQANNIQLYSYTVGDCKATKQSTEDRQRAHITSPPATTKLYGGRNNPSLELIFSLLIKRLKLKAKN